MNIMQEYTASFLWLASGHEVFDYGGQRDSFAAHSDWEDRPGTGGLLDTYIPYALDVL